jgi:hypothetical protein
MKKTIYLASWLVLTGTDAILGYKTAVSDFGINDNSLAIIWALGFSLLSVPLKVIYERVIETNYRLGGIFGNVIFLTFSAVWLFVCYQAYTGISELRKKDMNRLQLETIRQDFDEQKHVQETTKVDNLFNYRLAKKRLNYKAKQDSVILQSKLEQQKYFIVQQKKLLEEGTGQGFLYFNLLLILSASICLNLALEEERTLISETKKVDSEIEVLQDLPITKTEIEEVLVIEKPKDLTVYVCNSCEKEFTRHGYNAHFRSNINCTKGGFTKIIKQ